MKEMSKDLDELSPAKRELLDLLLKKEKTETTRATLVPRGRDAEFFPLSHGQKALWFLQQLNPENVAYNISTAMRIRTVLDVDALRRTTQRMFDRHASLRTTFHSVNGEPMQRVHEQMDSGFREVEGTQWSDAELHDFLVQEARRPFDLERGPLMRVTLVARPNEEHVLLMVLHHVIADLWSLVVLTQELGVLYPAEKSGQSVELPPLELQYTDYVLWQTEMLYGPEGRRNWEYWQKQLAGELPVLAIPTDRPRPPAQTFNGASQTVMLDGELTRKIKSLAQQEGATLYMTMLAAYATLLYRSTGQEDLLIGSPTSGRDRIELAGLVGYFVNPIVLRADLSGDPAFRSFLSNVRRTVLGAFEHQDFPFSLLTERLHPPRDNSRSPVFQTSFVLQKAQSAEQKDVLGFVQAEADARINVGGLEIEFLPVYKKTSQFDLRLTVAEANDGLSVVLNYNTDLFDDATITRMLDHYRVLLEAIVANPDETISRLPLLTDEERTQLLVEWNQTAAEYPRDRRIHDLFEAQVEQSPDALALVFKDQALTYRELNARVNQLAHHLQHLGVGPEVFVAMCVERSVEMIVGLLSILKAGGAYVPIDPHYPQERMRMMLDDAGVTVILTQERFVADLSRQGATVVCLDAIGEEVACQSTENTESAATASSAAYVIYTSGSTGKPKGVVLEHRSTVALIHWARTIFSPADLACVLASATINFDCSVFEIYVPLCWGGKIILAKNALELPSLPEAQEITLLNTVPSSMAELLRVNGIPESVRTVNLSGDLLPPALVTQLYQRKHIERVHNGYGPTEDTTFTTFALVKRENEGPPPIGRPVDNEQVYLLDRHLNLVPIGIPGELCIAGDGLARGYLNRPEATAEKFVPNPFDATPGARLYRTGDLARYRPDGNIEFIGRIDHQVKIRGFRVELGEVEATLSQHPAIRDVVVMAREDTPGVKRLVAYVVPAQPTALNTSELRSFVSERLPEYMVPSIFMVMESMPVTSGCKVDRRALPAPEPNRPELAQEFVAPRNEREEALASIWREVLGVEQVGVFDNFFDLGGDSILSLQVISRANQAGFGVTAKQLFQHQTIAGLATLVGTAPAIEAEQGLVLGPVPLTPIQHWFFEQDIPEAHHWNLSVVLELNEQVEEAFLRQALEGILLHHDALRLRFTKGENGWEQRISEPSEQLPFSAFDVSTLSEAEQTAMLETTAARLQTSLNLTEGPLMQMALFNFGPGEPARLLLIVHHLVVDGISWRILLEDIQGAYRQLKSGHALQLPRKTSSFKAWAERLEEYAQSAAAREELSYWLGHAASRLPSLPLDFPDGENTTASARTVSVSLGAEETEELLRSVLAASRSQMNDLLLTALGLALFRWNGERSVLLHLEGHGREELFPEIEVSRTVGWFTTMFPVRLDLGEATGVAALRSIKGQLRQIPQKGIGYGVLRYLSEETKGVEQFQALAHPELSFNYLGQFDQVLRGDSSYGQARESVGPSRSTRGSRSHVFDVSGMIVEGQLKVTWIYSENLHRRETVEQLAQGFLKELRALIAEVTSVGTVEPFVAPRTPVEEAVANVWMELLTAERVSAHETFFDLGGDQTAVRQAHRVLQEMYEIEIPEHVLAGTRTISEWSQAIDEVLLQEIEGLTEEAVRELI